MQQNIFGFASISVAGHGRLAVAWRMVRQAIIAADGLLALWHFRAKSRKDLERLDERLLRDMGFDPVEARREANKPFWRR